MKWQRQIAIIENIVFLGIMQMEVSSFIFLEAQFSTFGFTFYFVLAISHYLGSAHLVLSRTIYPGLSKHLFGQALSPRGRGLPLATVDHQVSGGRPLPSLILGSTRVCCTPCLWGLIFPFTNKIIYKIFINAVLVESSL